MPAKGAPMLDPHGALICTMMMVSAADRDMAETELAIIGDIVGDLPAFRDFDHQRLPEVLEECSRLLGRENGLEDALASIKKALPVKLRETAYAIACDVAAADGEASQEELRVLELIRHRLVIDREFAPDIEDQLDPRDIDFVKHIPLALAFGGVLGNHPAVLDPAGELARIQLGEPPHQLVDADHAAAPCAVPPCLVPWPMPRRGSVGCCLAHSSRNFANSGSSLAPITTFSVTY